MKKSLFNEQMRVVDLIYHILLCTTSSCHVNIIYEYLLSIERFIIVYHRLIGVINFVYEYRRRAQ